MQKDSRQIVSLSIQSNREPLSVSKCKLAKITPVLLSVLFLFNTAACAQQQPGKKRQLIEQLRQAGAKPNAPESRGAAIEYTATVRDLSYGKDPLQKLDIYSPQDAKALPVVLFVHGGGWRNGDKGHRAHQDKGSAFTENGVVLVSINYRLSPQVTHPAHVEDLASAFSWVRTNIEKYGGDPGKIYLMGHSAGAHLVLLLAANQRFLTAHKLSTRDISGVISLDTASLDLIERTAATNTGGELGEDMFESAFGHDKKVLTDASPTLNISKGTAYPLDFVKSTKPTPKSWL